MIFVGTDIVPISRIDQIILNKGQRFLDHVFTKTEQDICSNKANPSIHFGGKFAAKEAVKKAILSSKIIENIPLKAIEILNKNNGAPVVSLVGKSNKYKHIQVSISHAGDYATATAILENN